MLMLITINACGTPNIVVRTLLIKEQMRKFCNHGMLGKQKVENGNSCERDVARANT